MRRFFLNTLWINGFIFFALVSHAQKKYVDVDLHKVSDALWLKKYPAVKHKIDKLLKRHRQELLQGARTVLQEFPDTHLLPYRLYVKELVHFQSQKSIVSVRMQISTYTGGAHSQKNYYSYNWSLKQKKFLSLTEVIPHSRWPYLIKYVRHRLLVQQRQKGIGTKTDRRKNIEGGLSKKEDFKVWNFHSNGLLFTFPEYQVASFVHGFFTVFVPFSKIGVPYGT